MGAGVVDGAGTVAVAGVLAGAGVVALAVPGTRALSKPAGGERALPLSIQGIPLHSPNRQAMASS